MGIEYRNNVCGSVVQGMRLWEWGSNNEDVKVKLWEKACKNGAVKMVQWK